MRCIHAIDNDKGWWMDRHTDGHTYRKTYVENADQLTYKSTYADTEPRYEKRTDNKMFLDEVIQNE